jgi:hypothetical protein
MVPYNIRQELQEYAWLLFSGLFGGWVLGREGGREGRGRGEGGLICDRYRRYSRI